MSDVATFEDFIGFDPATLGEHDIALLNLRAAFGLPGTDPMPLDAYLDRLDEWADRVRIEICRHLHRYDPSPNEPTEFSHGDSLGRFLCWYMLQVLQEDCGVRYHPDRRFDPDFCEPQDVFIHGILDDDGLGGTCASMPVVYVAIGGRLGFPVKLVGTKGHMFFRWDDPHGTTLHWNNPRLELRVPPERFNVEGSGEGIAFYADAHYVQWPEMLTAEDFEQGRYLKSLDARETFADFLIQRAECFHDLGNHHEALKSIHYARQLAPDDPRYEWLHAKRTRELEQRERAERERRRELEDQAERNRLGIKVPNGHPRDCGCNQCKKAKLEASGPRAPHGPSCQCRHCVSARHEAESRPSGQPGHGPNCACHGCRRLRNDQPGPGVLSRPQPPGRHLPQPPKVRPGIPHHP